MRVSPCGRTGLYRSAVLAAVLTPAVLPDLADAVVIDDFTAGAVVLETTGEFDSRVVNQSGLPTAGVAAGTRGIRLQEGSRSGPTLTPDDNVSIAIDPSAGGSLTYRADGGLTGINTALRYESEPIDLTAGGANALVLSFASASFPGSLTGDGRGYLDVSLGAVGGSASLYAPVPTLPGPFEIVVDFAAVERFDPTTLTFLSLGTSNGNLPGEFTLTEIASRPVLSGDYNGDGRVDAADFTALRDAGDGYYRFPRGVVTVLGRHDIDAWRANLGSSAGAAPIPEPHAWLLATAALAGAALPRR